MSPNKIGIMEQQNHTYFQSTMDYDMDQMMHFPQLTPFNYTELSTQPSYTSLDQPSYTSLEFAINGMQHPQQCNSNYSDEIEIHRMLKPEVYIPNESEPDQMSRSPSYTSLDQPSYTSLEFAINGMQHPQQCNSNYSDEIEIHRMLKPEIYIPNESEPDQMSRSPSYTSLEFALNNGMQHPQQYHSNYSDEIEIQRMLKPEVCIPNESEPDQMSRSESVPSFLRDEVSRLSSAYSTATQNESESRSPTPTIRRRPCTTNQIVTCQKCEEEDEQLKSFSTNHMYHIINHLSYHNNDIKRFECNGCGFASMRKDKLCAHISKFCSGAGASVRKSPLYYSTLSEWARNCFPSMHDHIIEYTKQNNMDKIVTKRIHKTTSNKTITCQLCDKMIRTTTGSWGSHAKTHSEMFRYHCSVCGKAGHMKSNLAIHVNRAHRGDAEVIDKETPEMKADYKRLYEKCFPCLL